MEAHRISYGNEPLDANLNLLRMLRKWWILPLGMGIGAGIVALIYFIVHVCMGPGQQYVTEAQYYVEYKDAITYEQQYTFYNQTTWETLSDTDLFVKACEERLAKDGLSLTRDEIREAVKATLDTDVRVVHLCVTASSPEVSFALYEGMDEGMSAFGQQQLEMDEIRRITTPEGAYAKDMDNRTLRAAILGAVIGFFVTMTILYIYVISDTSFFVPLEITRRFHIPAAIGEPANNRGDSVFLVENVIYIKAEDKNAHLVEQIIREAKMQGEEIQKAVLFDADERLVRAYMFPKKKKEGKK